MTEETQPENQKKSILQYFLENEKNLTPNQVLLAQIMTTNAINYVNRNHSRLDNKQKAERRRKNKQAKLSRKINRKK